MSSVPGQSIGVCSLVLLLHRWRFSAAFWHRRIAVRCDASPATDMLAPLDEPAQRFALRMLLLRMLGRQSH